MPLLLGLGEVRGVGSRGDRDHDVGQRAKAVRHTERIGEEFAEDDQQHRDAVEPEEAQNQPLGQTTAPWSQAGPTRAFGDHLHVRHEGGRGRVQHGREQVVPGEPGQHAGGQVEVVHGSLRTEVLTITSRRARPPDAVRSLNLEARRKPSRRGARTLS